MKPFKTLLLALCPIWLMAQTEVKEYHPGVTTDGITYFLPQTGFRFVIKVTHTRHTPGEYAIYGERFLRERNVTVEAYDEWKIESVEMVPFGEADRSQAYTIKFKTQTSAPLVGLADDGRLLSVNAAAHPLPELPKATFPKNVASTGSKNAGQFKTQEILSAGSTQKMAELAAAEIFDIRENRGLLAKGQADFMPKDGEQLKLMLESLDKQEQGLLSLFTGTTDTDERILTLDIVPTEEWENRLLFRFSRHYGMVDNDDLSGEPFFLTVKDLHTLPPVEPDPRSAKAKKKEVQDLRYNVPGKARLKLTDSKGQVLCEHTFPIAQFGRVEHLGGELFNKRHTTHVTLSPETGGIASIKADQPE